MECGGCAAVTHATNNAYLDRLESYAEEDALFLTLSGTHAMAKRMKAEMMEHLHIHDAFAIGEQTWERGELLA